MLYFKIHSVTPKWELILDDFECTFDISDFIHPWDVIKDTKSYKQLEREILKIEWPFFCDD